LTVRVEKNAGLETRAVKTEGRLRGDGRVPANAGRFIFIKKILLTT
jgi:hypothetical protein